MKRIVAMSFNSKFFKAGLTLIASIHRNSFNSVDEIIIYDLGLTPREAKYLSRCAKVRLVKYPSIINSFFDGYMEPRQFAWKPLVIKNVGQYGDRILYIDAGVMTLQDLQIIFDLIDKDDIFLVQDYNPNATFTHARAFELMQATAKERTGMQLWAGIFGYKVNGKYQQLVDEAYTYSQNKEIVHGDRQYHRHDQSIYSVLAIRYQCPTQSLEKYGEFRGILHPDQVIYVHRRKYSNKKGLKLEPGPLTRWFKQLPTS